MYEIYIIVDEKKPANYSRDNRWTRVNDHVETNVCCEICSSIKIIVVFHFSLRFLFISTFSWNFKT